MIKTNYPILQSNLTYNPFVFSIKPEFIVQKKQTQIMQEYYYIQSLFDKNIHKMTLAEKEIMFPNRQFRKELQLSYPEHFENYSFIQLYQNYRTNLETGHKVHVDLNGLDQEILNNYFSNLNLNVLEEFFNEWKYEIINVNHGKPGLKSAIKKEVKKQLDEYYKEDENKFKKIIQTNFTLNCDYCMLILHSKWVYLLTQKIIETYNNYENYYELNLNENKIRFTITSLVHILIKHYGLASKIAKSYKNEEECSNHSENVHFERIHTVLKTIFGEIDESRVLEKNYIKDIIESETIKKNYITVKFKNTYYRIYISKNKNENGDNIAFNEINTFYPLNKKILLNDLNLYFKKEKINDNLYLFIENK